VSRKICVVTGARSEYGLLRWVMRGIREAPDLELQVIVTGMHLSPEFGLTFREIEADGFRIDRRVEMLLSADTPGALCKSIGLGMIGLADALDQLRPDLVVILGDRFEMLAVATAALVSCIPIAHIHGGETTEGAIDEAIRHSITKMSQLHFVAAEPYRRRVIQLGEQPDHVFDVGGLGVDSVTRMTLLDRAGLEQALGFALGRKNLLVTFHPVTLEPGVSVAQMTELLGALDALPDVHLVFTMPNADTGGRALGQMIERFVAARANAHVRTSLGQLVYLSCVLHVDGVVGNSSSGLTEVPSLRKGTVNIGDRQRGRLRARSVIDCPPDRSSIVAALDKLLSPEFRETLPAVQNPYGDGGASARIVQVLRSHSLEGLVKKAFYDLPSPI